MRALSGDLATSTRELHFGLGNETLNIRHMALNGLTLRQTSTCS